MGCGVREAISFFFCRIYNPKKPDNDTKKAVYRLNACYEYDKFIWWKKRLERIEAERKRSEEWYEAELKRLTRVYYEENNNGGRKRRISEEELFIPSDVLHDNILGRLALKDKIRFSTVCKTWGGIAAAYFSNHRGCRYWLMYIDPCHPTTKGVSYGFYDPVEKKKTKVMSLPEFSKSSVIVHSKDGWLLIYKYVRYSSVYHRLFFFNPFTREQIHLPVPNEHQCSFSSKNFAFSCAPTKSGCLVFLFDTESGSRRHDFTVSTWYHPGAAASTTWVNKDYNFSKPPCREFDRIENIIYLDGVFYVAAQMAIGVFDPSGPTWNVLPVKPIPVITNPTSINSEWINDYMQLHPSTCNWFALPVGHLLMPNIRWITEYKGHIHLVDASSLDLRVFKLNLPELVWEKKDTLDGSSIFLSNGSCEMTCGLAGSMSNIVYVWNHYVNRWRPTKYYCSFKQNMPFKYSLHSKSECEDPQGYYFEYRTNTEMDGVWIEPPSNVSISAFSIIEPCDAVNTSLFI